MLEFKVYTCDCCYQKIDKYRGWYEFRKDIVYKEKDLFDDSMIKEKMHFCNKCFKKIVDNVYREVSEENATK